MAFARTGVWAFGAIVSLWVQGSEAIADLRAFTSRLPVIVIDNAGAGSLQKASPDQTVSFQIFEPDSEGARVMGRAPQLALSATISVRGASSSDFPKKSFNVTLRDQKGNKQARSLLGMPAAEKWALVAPWSYDLSFIHNAFVYALSNQMGRWAPRTRIVEVFFNTRGAPLAAADYVGVYVLVERIEVGGARVNLAPLTRSDASAPAITGGYIFKIDYPAVDDVAWKTELLAGEGGSSVVLISPRAEDVTPGQQDYLRGYLEQMERALRSDHARAWQQRTSSDFIDLPSWVDHHLINTFVCNPDALVRSAYFTKDRGEKLSAGPVWDFDRALGSYWDARSYRWDVWQGLGGTEVWTTGWWGLIARDPEFRQAWIDRWHGLRASVLSASSLTALARILAASVGAEAAARDAARWPDNQSPHGGYGMEINRLVEWLTQRAAWVDEQFVSAPIVVRTETTLTFSAPGDEALIYTLDGSDPRAVGGAIAANASVSSGSFTVPVGANVHVRCYRADWVGAFPATAWSGVAGGPQSTPVAPRSRLVNFSSRTTIGNGDGAAVVGFVVADTVTKRYLSRAIGPGLASFGVQGAARSPLLELSRADGTLLDRNGDWQGESGPELLRLSRAVGAFPLQPGTSDAALATAIGAGAYTLQITTPETAGEALLELYELETNGRTANMATRAMLRGNGGVLRGGFVVSGASTQRVLIRAVGPTLARLGVMDALKQPVLTLRSSRGVIAVNERWADADNANATARASATAGAFPIDASSGDAALFLTLPAGAYTFEVSSKDDSGGVVLLEIYDVP